MISFFDIQSVERCVNCRGCENDCPSFKVIEGYNPTLIGMDILRGGAGKWLTSPMIWQCVECHTCSEMCHQVYSWEKVMTTLKSIAIAKGLAPAQVKRGAEMLRKTARLGEPRDSMRSKLDLPEVPPAGLDDFRELFG